MFGLVYLIYVFRVLIVYVILGVCWYVVLCDFVLIGLDLGVLSYVCRLIVMGLRLIWVC